MEEYGNTDERLNRAQMGQKIHMNAEHKKCLICIVYNTVLLQSRINKEAAPEQFMVGLSLRISQLLACFLDKAPSVTGSWCLSKQLLVITLLALSGCTYRAD